MKEAKWLACDNPGRVLKAVAGRAGARKVRLALCGCLRSPVAWPRLAPTSRRSVGVAEEFADGAAGLAELAQARRLANAAANRKWQSPRASRAAAYCSTHACLQDRNLLSGLATCGDYLEQFRPPAGLLRDVFGNPFRPVTLDPSWLTSTVVSLAEAIYAGRAYHNLPILADALEDSGCDDAEVLGHCRGEGPHVRGCWVLDAITGRK